MKKPWARRGSKRRSFVGDIPLLCLALSALVIASPSRGEWYSDTQAIMGTSVSVTLWHEDANVAHSAINAVMAEMRRIDDTLSPFKEDSELAKVNREAVKGPVTISPELATIIDKALYFSRLSDGAFDISFASVGRYYDYRNKQQPDAQQRQSLLPAIDYHLIALDKDRFTIAFKHPQLQIDLGGIAKGYAVDRSVAILKARGIEYATLSAGGDSRLMGDKRGKLWLIGIKNPRGRDDEDRVAIVLPLENTAISTSGDYERYFIDEETGERVHHIINPRTGTSATGVASVSIIGPHGFDTDPMSTTVFVLGVEKGLQLVNRLPGFDCVIIDSAGKVHYSDGLMPPTDQ